MGIKRNGSGAILIAPIMKHSLPVNRVLDMALGKIAEDPGVVVIGKDHDGNLYVAGSNKDHHLVAALVREGMEFLDEVVATS